MICWTPGHYGKSACTVTGLVSRYCHFHTSVAVETEKADLAQSVPKSKSGVVLSCTSRNSSLDHSMDPGSSANSAPAAPQDCLLCKGTRVGCRISYIRGVKYMAQGLNLARRGIPFSLQGSWQAREFWGRIWFRIWGYGSHWVWLSLVAGWAQTMPTQSHIPCGHLSHGHLPCFFHDWPCRCLYHGWPCYLFCLHYNHQLWIF